MEVIREKNERPAQKSRTTSLFEVSEETKRKLEANERRWSKERANRREIQRLASIAEGLRRLIDRVGRRYGDCELASFIPTNDKAKDAISFARRYSTSLDSNIENGINILAFGSVGTGKTHLLVSLAKEAIRAGFGVCWRSGPALWSELVERIRSDDGVESEALRPIIAADVFVLDDPLGVADSLSDYRREKLYQIIDARNRALRPTWVALNLPNRGAIEEAMGKATVDRLCCDCLRLCMAWKSAREGENWGAS